jgi:hypothetical protein
MVSAGQTWPKGLARASPRLVAGSPVRGPFHDSDRRSRAPPAKQSFWGHAELAWKLLCYSVPITERVNPRDVFDGLPLCIRVAGPTAGASS